LDFLAVGFLPDFALPAVLLLVVIVPVSRFAGMPRYWFQAVGILISTDLKACFPQLPVPEFQAIKKAPSGALLRIRCRSDRFINPSRVCAYHHHNQFVHNVSFLRGLKLPIVGRNVNRKFLP
jgi:hypothetical protein